MKLRFTRAAKNDLKSIHDYIAADDRLAATRVVERIKASTQLLVAFPHLGRVGLAEGTYEWSISGLPYIVIYEIDQPRGMLIVLAVFHTARHR